MPSQHSDSSMRQSRCNTKMKYTTVQKQVWLFWCNAKEYKCSEQLRENEDWSASLVHSVITIAF